MIMKYAITIAALVAVSFGMAACSGDDKPRNPIGPSPGTQTLLDPPDGATDQPLRVVLNWPGDSAATFDHFQLFFGPASPPPLIAGSISDTFFVTQPLQPGVSFFWRVVAVSDSGVGDRSSVWTFRTTDVNDTREIASFPLSVGARWDYQALSLQIDRLTGDSSVLFSGSAQLSVDSTTLGFDSRILHVLKQKIALSDGFECEENMFFENTSDGLLFYGSDNVCSIGPFPLRPVSQSSLYFRGRIFNSSSELLAYILPDGPLSGYAVSGSANKLGPEDPPILSLKYPLKIAQRWTYREPDNPFAIEKLVSLDETLTTDAGTFECLRVQWLHDIDANGIWDGDVDISDWIAEEGLIKRELIVRGVERRNEVGEVIGIYDFFQQHSLTAVQAAP